MHIVCTIFFCFLSTCLFGQYQNRPATITDRNDKVLSGIIHYYDWDKSPDFIEFTQDSSTVVKQIFIRSIKKLVISDGPIYESLYLKVPYYTKAPVAAGEVITDHIDSTYYLSELLLSSEPVKLYRFFDQNAAVRFLIAKYDSLSLLKDIHLQILRRETLFNFDDHAYQKQLRVLLYECPTLKTEKILYKEESLINLLKEYLSFCRIDSKIYLEQKKFGKASVGIGVFGAFWPSAEGNTLLYGLNLEVLLPRRLHNAFAMFNVGGIDQETAFGREKNFLFGIYGGRYFGRGSIQGKIYTGLSTAFGVFDTGIGLSYRKMISADIRYPVFSGLFSGLRDKDTFYIRPLINLTATIPISRSGNR